MKSEKSKCSKDFIRHRKNDPNTKTPKGGKMIKFSEKIKYTLYIDPAVLKRVDDLFKQDGCKSKSEFIERAVRFYCGYLSAENYRDYVPKVMLSTIKGSLDGFESRMASLMFKMSVELSVLNRVTAATVDTGDLNLPRIRADCVRDVKRIQGVITLAEAVEDEENK